MQRTLIALGLIGCGVAALGLGGCTTTGKPRQLVISQQCADIDFPIYFNRLSAKLTGPALSVIADAGRAAKGCTVASVSVVGLAGGQDPHRKLLDLSAARASNVAKALTNAGLPAPRFDVTAQANGHGPEDIAHEPLQRRAEVVITFTH